MVAIHLPTAPPPPTLHRPRLSVFLFSRFFSRIKVFRLRRIDPRYDRNSGDTAQRAAPSCRPNRGIHPINTTLTFLLRSLGKFRRRRRINLKTAVAMQSEIMIINLGARAVLPPALVIIQRHEPCVGFSQRNLRTIGYYYYC